MSLRRLGLVCELTKSLSITSSCSPTKRSANTRAKGVVATMTCKFCATAVPDLMDIDRRHIRTLTSDYTTWNTRQRMQACGSEMIQMTSIPYIDILTITYDIIYIKCVQIDSRWADRGIYLLRGPTFV